MKINTLIVDDNPSWQKTISKFVKLNPVLNLVGVCGSTLEAYGLIAENEVDLLICDIEMPELSGLSLAKSIQGGGPLVIFVTSHQHYAFDCYEVSPVDFLLKPLEMERFLKSIEKVKARLLNAPNAEVIAPYFFVKEGHSYVQIFYQDVQYIQAQEHFLNIVIDDEKSYSPMLSISKFEEQIKNDVFIRVHRSFIVNRAYIREISKNEIILTTGKSISIGEQYRSQIKRKHIAAYALSRGV